MRVRNSRTGAIVKDTFFNTGASLIQEMTLIEALEKDVPLLWAKWPIHPEEDQCGW
ncbi:MAG TPA: hypothetical protein VHZ54_13505 [Solirubrobacterales bacterium]|jgi:hypothetical protein|nr:hypothetical protein [Solirubrobacterales bacterium]